MSYRSWLKDVKKSYDLGSFLAHPSGDWDRDEKKELKFFDLKRVEHPSVVECMKYFYCALRWGQPISLARDGRDFIVTLHNRDTDNLMFGIHESLGLPTKLFKAPIDLRFHDAVYVNATRARRDGVLRHFSYDEFKFEDSLRRDWFHEQDGRLQWIGEFYAGRSGQGKLSMDVWLMIDCLKVSVLDQTREAVAKNLSEKAAAIWDDIRNSVELDPGGITYSDCKDYVTKRAVAHGFEISDLLSELPVLDTHS